MADRETHIRGNWRPLARDHAQFRPNKTPAALHPVIHTHIRTYSSVRAVQARARFCTFQAGSRGIRPVVWGPLLLSHPLFARSFSLARTMCTLATIEK